MKARRFTRFSGWPRLLLGCVLCALLVAALAPELQAAIIDVTAVLKDTSITQTNPANSDGAGAGLFSGTDGNNSIHRSLLAFDLSSLSGATITSVRLTLTLGQTAGGGPGTATIGLFSVNQDWGQGSAGQSSLLGGPSAGIGGSGQEFPASPGDATWSSAFYQQTLWTTPGGDHAASASVSLFLDNATNGNSFTWLSTPQLVADVQSWVSHPASNFGWELINANETTAKSLYGFYSSDWPSFPNGQASQQPVLEITYTVPEPGALALVGLAVLPLLALGRARLR